MSALLPRRRASESAMKSQWCSSPLRRRDLPEGTKLKLQLVDVPEALDDEAREALHAKLSEGLVAARAGRTVSVEALKTKLLSRP
jgi:hypothetical protein